MKSEVEIGNNRIRVTRVFDAPRERVFDAWKQSAKLQQWWGCRMTTRVESQIDFRPGGLFTHTMQIEGVGEMVYSGAYDEIIEPERISFHAGFGGITAHVTVEFLDLNGGTKLILTQTGFPRQEFCQVVSEGFGAGLDRLEQILAGEAPRAVEEVL